MGFFDRVFSKTREIVDPVFGHITFGDGTWDGAQHLPGSSGKVPFSIQAGTEGPGDAQRSAFHELTSRWATLQPQIGEALWTLYEPHLASFSAEEHGRLASIKSAPELLPLVTLSNVHVNNAGEIELLYGLLPEAGWDDAMFSISLANWQPTPLSLDD